MKVGLLAERVGRMSGEAIRLYLLQPGLRHEAEDLVSWRSLST